ncbi:MAG: thermonuclease family protein [Casimicrobiaceae bacterium]
MSRQQCAAEAARVACLIVGVLAVASAEARCAAARWPNRFEAVVLRVKDGDSLVVRRPSGFPGPAERTVRLARIDAPEYDQPHGQASRLWLRERVRLRLLAFETVATDRYCRLLVHAGAPGEPTDALNLALVAAGHAWVEARETDPRYRRAEAAARKARRGLWADPAPIPPAEWRRRKAGRAGGAR